MRVILSADESNIAAAISGRRDSDGDDRQPVQARHESGRPRLTEKASPPLSRRVRRQEGQGRAALPQKRQARREVSARHGSWKASGANAVRRQAEVGARQRQAGAGAGRKRHARRSGDSRGAGSTRIARAARRARPARGFGTAGRSRRSGGGWAGRANGTCGADRSARSGRSGGAGRHGRI
ncbi:hypothetical protein SAMN05216312_11548 [Cohnella sp. OV330]|nr:hypothetical protein SAMN05216312_11548 [Cohnella sp. OV330]